MLFHPTIGQCSFRSFFFFLKTKSIWQFTKIVFWELIFSELDCFQAIKLKNKNIYPSFSGISMVPEYKEELLRVVGSEYLFPPNMRSFMFLVCFMPFCGPMWKHFFPLYFKLIHPSKNVWKKERIFKTGHQPVFIHF